MYVAAADFVVQHELSIYCSDMYALYVQSETGPPEVLIVGNQPVA